ncbi:MAG: tRNA guanosine(15) transglycosylase TgtA [Candidatus Bathyarchaeota archaeon]|nr:MAG: tRNA guanosine(15) transglycosylase TgtA [Candidatus Bathyarchaeota archaeon]
MSFELRDRDLMGRIGRLRTKGGEVETPAFMPVVNPVTQTILPRRMGEEFSCEIIITNSYIIKKNFGDQPGLRVRDLLDYEGVIATDSGAYQLLVYGEVEITPEEIIRYQQEIGSDIAVILDIPTGWNESRSRVEYTVDETLRRARSALPLIQGDETLWVGPVQGGAHLDLVERSAREIGGMPFQIHALGSPTEVMESYNFHVLVDMIMAAKLNLPSERPLHLFGAGHPMMFSLAVALGCDLFDSAAYAIYARDGRYLTPLGTERLEGLSHLPCVCPVCSKHDAEELRGMLKGERVRLLTEHNLHATMAEMKRVKQSIMEGTLWELMEARSRGHPSLVSAMRKLYDYREALERKSPSFKGRGLFFFDSVGLARPEVTRHIKRLEANFPTAGKEALLLVRAPGRKPFTSAREYQRLMERLEEELPDGLGRLQVCFYAAPFGVVPAELSETYPLSQFVVPEPLDWETLEFAAEKVASFFEAGGYAEAVLHRGEGDLDILVGLRCEEVSKKTGKELKVVSDPAPWGEGTLDRLISALETSLA